MKPLAFWCKILQCFRKGKSMDFIVVRKNVKVHVSELRTCGIVFLTNERNVEMYSDLPFKYSPSISSTVSL